MPLAVSSMPLSTFQLSWDVGSSLEMRWGNRLSHLRGKSMEAMRAILSPIWLWIWGGTVHMSSTRLFLMRSRSSGGMVTDTAAAASSSSSGAHPFLTRFLKWTAADWRMGAY